MRPSATFDLHRLNSLFDRQRLLFYCGVLLAFELTIYLLFIGSSYGLLEPLAAIALFLLAAARASTRRRDAPASRAGLADT